MNSIPRSMCPGCPYRAPLAAMNRLWLRAVSGGGCSALGAQRPFLAVELAAGEGAALTALAARLSEDPGRRGELVALCPVSELGAPGLDTLSRCGGTALVPGTESPTGLCRQASVPIFECSAFDLASIEAALRSALGSGAAAVVFCRGECARSAGKTALSCSVSPDYCRRCGACLRLGCPAISGSRPPEIDPGLCTGCGVCAQVCRCSAIREA